MTKLLKRIIIINQRRTSMRLCRKEWCALEEICSREQINRNELIAMIEDNKNNRLGLSYATRLFLLLYYNSLANHTKSKIVPNIINELVKRKTCIP